MFRGQAHHILFGLLFYNIIYINVCVSNAIESQQVHDGNYMISLKVLDNIPDQISLGKNVTLSCKTNSTDPVQWFYNGENITDSNLYTQIVQEPEEDDKFFISFLHIYYMDFEQAGNYTCSISNEFSQIEDTKTLNITIKPVIIKHTNIARIKIHDQVTLYCTIEGYPLYNIHWLKDDDVNSIKSLINNTRIDTINNTMQNISLHMEDIRTKDNGRYICRATGIDEEVQGEILLQVLDKPQVQIDTVKALGTNIIFLNWTVNDGNDPDNLKYQIQYMEDESTSWLFYPEQITGSKTYAVLENKSFKNNTYYSIRMEAENNQGAGMKSNILRVKTLEKDPEFKPEVKVTGVTVSSITVSWSPLPPELLEHINYYQLKLWSLNSTTKIETIHSTPGDHLYMFRDLAPATLYEFQVAACSEHIAKCGPWSNVVNGTTNDGISEPPENVTLGCNYDNISHTSFVYVSWKPPRNPNGKIIHYNVLLEGEASYINEQGKTDYSTWGPKMTSVSEKSLHTRFYNISANTNYTVKISAVTRSKRHGNNIALHCTMPPTIPDKSKLSRYSWMRVDEQGKWMFKLFLPRISERNGAICCYRVYMIRMEPEKGLAELPSPEDLPVGTYSEAHRTPKGGAYVAEMFASGAFQSEVFLGDDHVLNYTNSPCIHCTGLNSNRLSREKHKPPTTTTTTTSTSTSTTTSTTSTTTTAVPLIVESTVADITDLPIKLRRSIPEELDYLPPHDGILDINSNYTGFVEVVVYGHNKGETLTAYSNYFDILNPGPPQVLEVPTTQILGIVIQILCALILVVLVLLMALCVLHRYTKQVAHAQGIEMITFRNSFRSLRGRHRLVSLSPSDMSPIAKADLVNVYIERHRDSDYGFQREFELLPDRFSDRTTRASEARENIYKNRYPDIKAYDQTRVKLAQIDSIAGSDYINANFVIGYKERKKFICAQGPMDNTVCDYWRMIWEQHLEIILMLTNLEEYSKTKCAKYWPDKTEGEKTFGDITVTHVEEKRCSDYIIRQLRITRQNSNRAKDERFITQYHYLVWKDFMAPEHPHGIIKFIKRMNEAYSLEKGSILVHCSAGVGRTGTLVALDSLLQQLAEEGQVAIFNTVCDLRHQRNFLVQSLKQYIFIYRALMEVAQYGDTEIQASELKTIVDKLKRSETGRSKMEEDYEKIKNAVEDRKSFTVGGGEENHQKNRSELVIPYDRNRVILTPIPGREHSTYINASFIEGYDNSESFIITQDPLEQTIADFWRMISEQGICVIVMLSNLGDSTKKCPRYWPDDEVAYDHIIVKYIQSESCPYYTRREFVVTNNKSDEKVMVTQFQYHGWPTVEGEVPEVTRGLIELVDQTQSVQSQNDHTAPLVVHCCFGSDRSSMFVGLSILVQQLRVERRVDVFTTTRKLRSQRQGMISTFAQYEFLHRAIMNYADLHQLCDNS